MGLKIKIVISNKIEITKFIKLLYIVEELNFLAFNVR